MAVSARFFTTFPRYTVPALAGLSLLCAGAAQATECSEPDGGEITAICDLGLPTDGVYGSGEAVSADGSVVVGYTNGPNGDIGNRAAFRWTEADGMASLGTLGGNWSWAWDVNADGSVVVGYSTSEEGTRAFRWTEADGMVSLGTIPEGAWSVANGVNADGSVAVGYGSNSDGYIRALRWTAADGMASLGALSSRGESYAYGVSADGSVIVGSSDSDDGIRAFRWTEADGMVSLGALTSGGESTALGVNADGSVAVGYGSNGDGYNRAFRWTAADGMVSLGTLTGGGSSRARGVNADGSVVVGNSDSDDGDRAFRWTAADGMISLGTLTGGGWSSASDVSDDGSVIVGTSGNADGNRRAVIWRDLVIEDYANLIGSVELMASDTALAAQTQSAALGQVMDLRGFAAEGQSYVALRGGLSRNAADLDAWGRSKALSGTVAFGRGVSDKLTLGGSVTLEQDSLSNNAYDLDHGSAGALWGIYSASGDGESGLIVSGSLGRAEASGRALRGRLLSDVVLAGGDVTLRSTRAEVVLAYGLPATHGWRLTPHLGLSQTRSTRGAYDESGGSFNASYDAARERRNTVTVGLDAETAAGPGRLRLSGGVSRDLSVAAMSLSGSSDIPGLTSFDYSAGDGARTRPFAAVHYMLDLSEQSQLSAGLSASRSVYGGNAAGLDLRYEMRF